MVKSLHILQKVANPATFENVNKNVKNAVCAGDFKTRKIAIFNFIVTNFSTSNKNCDCNFLIGRRASATPF
jgi:hypothetical protein